MSRELKFRAWDKTRIRYDVTGFEHGLKNEMDGVFIDGNCFSLSKGKAIVMQYTGLKDENGKEIYEGDILEFSNASGMEDGVCVVAWDAESLAWYIENYEADIYTELYNITSPANIRIVGNIYENQELAQPMLSE
jgi:uncharacterized phage protein (TIGR01671 family)